MVSLVNKQLATTMHLLDLQISSEFAHRLKTYELTTEQFAVLAALWQRDGIKQRDLAELLGKDAPNMTRILEKMEKREWVRRLPSAKDKRVTLVYNHDRSIDNRPELQSIAEKFRDELYHGISAAEQTMLFAMLNRLLSNLKKIHDKPSRAARP